MKSPNPSPQLVGDVVMSHGPGSASGVGWQSPVEAEGRSFPIDIAESLQPTQKEGVPLPLEMPGRRDGPNAAILQPNRGEVHTSWERFAKLMIAARAP